MYVSSVRVRYRVAPNGDLRMSVTNNGGPPSFVVYPLITILRK
jgi:hypothetical protein